MSERGVNVFSDDPLLAPYLARYLQAQTCNLLDEGELFYLRFSYFEKLPLLGSSAKREQATKGLSAVLDLISPAFDMLPAPAKRESGETTQGIGLAYTPPFAPVTFTINSNGAISVQGNLSIETLVGTFALGP